MHFVSSYFNAWFKSHQGSINVELSHVIDQNRKPEPLAILLLQDVLEQGGLAGSKEAGQQGHGDGEFWP